MKLFEVNNKTNFKTRLGVYSFSTWTSHFHIETAGDGKYVTSSQQLKKWIYDNVFWGDNGEAIIPISPDGTVVKAVGLTEEGDQILFGYYWVNKSGKLNSWEDVKKQYNLI